MQCMQVAFGRWQLAISPTELTGIAPLSRSLYYSTTRASRLIPLEQLTARLSGLTADDELAQEPRRLLDASSLDPTPALVSIAASAGGACVSIVRLSRVLSNMCGGEVMAREGNTCKAHY